MTTASWSTRVRHDSDAVYQEWRDEVITKLGLMVTGTVLAADETNITPGAGAKPGTNTEQGYAVYHISDSLHGTAPIYLRFGFGTGSSTNVPRMQLTMGTSTNGSGVLGGTCLSTIGTFVSSNNQTGDTARQSYICAKAGFFGFGWKFDTTQGGVGGEGFCMVCRTCDSDGVPTVTGAILRMGNATVSGVSKSQAFRFATTAVAYTAKTAADAMLGFMPQAPTATTSGSDVQCAVGWTISPRASPIFGCCGVYVSELAAGGTFTTTVVGSTPRTYITLYNTAGPFSQITATATAGYCAIAMLWE
jgi:hypothetical protein